MAHDFLYDLPVGFSVSTGLDYWTPDGAPEYYFEVRLAFCVYLPN